LSKEWADMDKNKKDKYEKRAKEGKEQYEADKKSFLEAKGGDTNSKAVVKKKGGD